MLSRGKSFRHHEPKRYIRHHQSACTVWARTKFEEVLYACYPKADETGKSDSILRFNEHTVSTQSTLSFHLPTLLIDPVSMSLLDEGSISRRQMLDWLTFHIQPSFIISGYNTNAYSNKETLYSNIPAFIISFPSCLLGMNSWILCACFT